MNVPIDVSKSDELAAKATPGPKTTQAKKVQAAAQSTSAIDFGGIQHALNSVNLKFDSEVIEHVKGMVRRL